MSFDSFQAFLAMGGHGLYVWSSYGAAVIIVLYNVVSVRLALRRFFQEARDRQRRHAPRETCGSDLSIADSDRSRSGNDSHRAAITGESTRS